LLERHTQNVAALSTEIQLRPSRDEIAATSPISHSSITGAAPSSMSNMQNDMDTPTTPWYQNSVHSGNEGLPPLTIPVKHNTSSSYLLSLPEMKALVGEYPPDLFFMLESRNPLPPELLFDGWLTPVSHVHIDRNITDYLISTFFSEVSHCHPILDHGTFQGIYSRFLETGVDSSIESALCLTVCALGAAALATRDVHDSTMTPAGMEYMQSAIPTLISLSSWSFSWNILLPQALVLASIYFAYIVRPLQSWRLIYSASTILQFKLSR
jgi:hypothetical protein